MTQELSTSTTPELTGVARAFLQANPQIADSLGIDRIPHEFSADETTGAMFDPNRMTVEDLSAKIDKLFDSLPRTGGASGPVAQARELPSAPTSGVYGQTGF